MTNTEKSLIRSLQRGLQIINTVAGRGPLHAKPVALSIGLPLPTAYHPLGTLVHIGCLSRLDDGTYGWPSHRRVRRNTGRESSSLR